MIQPELGSGLAVSMVFAPVPMRGMIPLTPRRLPCCPPQGRANQKRPHVSPKACYVLLLNVPHRLPPVQQNVVSGCLLEHSRLVSGRRERSGNINMPSFGLSATPYDLDHMVDEPLFRSLGPLATKIAAALIF